MFGRAAVVTHDVVSSSFVEENREEDADTATTAAVVGDVDEIDNGKVMAVITVSIAGVSNLRCKSAFNCARANANFFSCSTATYFCASCCASFFFWLSRPRYFLLLGILIGWIRWNGWSCSYYFA